MKKIKYIALATASVAMAGVMGVPTAVAGIADTRHNLVSGVNSFNRTDGTDEICVFCHTPHGANSSQSVPLWNRYMSDPTSFTTYDALGSSTLDGTIISVGSVSLACLSCHDGTVAMDSLMNMPGSGAGTVTEGTKATGAAWAWTTGNGTPVNADGTLGAGIAQIGLDLRDDHPVGILYAGGNVVGNESASANFKDSDFVAVQTTTINSLPYWWIDQPGGTANQRERTDIILYTRLDATEGVTSNAPFVECASCHDPHVSDKPLFLRIDNAGSALCLACHIK
jgi:predicted CXXCH cytochrome family protein